MSEELKPCPFCKSAGKLYNHYGNRRKYGWDVDCSGNKHCRGYGGGYIAIWTKEDAIKAWNTRADNALIDTLVEALEWYIQNDDTRDEEGNEYSLKDADKARKSLAEAKKWKGEV
jgi:hypothetical protein